MSKMTIAKYLLYSNVSVKEVSNYYEEDIDYIRITDTVEVEFNELSDEVIIPQRIAAYDAEIEEARNVAAKKIAGIEERKAELMVLTHAPD